jgi:hypothetical protein
MIEITPPRVFFGALTLISVIIWLVGGCGFLAKAMHAQAMEYNEVYTGENEENEDEGKDEGKGDSKLPTLKKRK